MAPSWRYYQHMMLPTCAPHEEPDLSSVKDGSVFRVAGTPLLARWTSDFDCGDETDFWYVIKDTPFDINALKAKRRYEIMKGMRNFVVRPIKGSDYAKAMADVMETAYTSWPNSYRPSTNKERWEQGFLQWDCGQDESRIYGAFDNNECLCGFAHVDIHENFAEYDVLRVNPPKEKQGINAAITYAIMQDFGEKLSTGKYYISDGTRNVSHETHFQDYLCKYFGWRKAYCNLHIKYRFPVGMIVDFLYPLRKFLGSDGRFGHKIKALMAMEEMRRNCSKTYYRDHRNSVNR